MSTVVTPVPRARCEAVVLWIDWYAYHIARFVGLQAAFGTQGEITGLEMVGGAGVHEGLTFRENLPDELPVETLLPDCSWKEANKVALARAVWNRLTALDPQVVLVPGYYTLPALAAAVWARRNNRISVLMTESTEADHARSRWKEKVKSLLICQLFDWAVTGGAAHVRYLRALNFPADRITSFYDVIGNDKLREGVQATRSRSTAAHHGLPQEYLLYVGRLAPEKNVAGLLRAWAEYHRQGGRRHLVLVGDGESRNELRRIAQESGFGDQVHFAGHKGSRELWPYFAFGAAFVLPSKREPWGLVVNEAMAAGLPVFVSTHCGCAESLVGHEENGYLFNPDRMEELTEYLLTFDRLPAETQERMGTQSSKRIAVYSPNSFGREIAMIARQGRSHAGARDLFEATAERAAVDAGAHRKQHSEARG